MPTIYQRYQHYQQQKGAIPFSKKKLKALYFVITTYWNKGHAMEKITYVESIEGDHSYPARNYPDYFTHNIDRIIWQFHTRLKNNYLSVNAPGEIIKRPPRSRKPIGKPVFSGKPLNNKS